MIGIRIKNNLKDILKDEICCYTEKKITEVFNNNNKYNKVIKIKIFNNKNVIKDYNLKSDKKSKNNNKNKEDKKTNERSGERF